MKKIYTEGRPPWFTFENSTDKREPLVIGVTGGSASGKTSVCSEIIKAINVPWVVLISMDSFYKGLPEGIDHSGYNFDHPDAFDFDLLFEILESLKQGKSVEIPHYDFTTHSRVPSLATAIYGADVIILEGILVLYDERLRDMMDIKLFVDTEDDIRLARRLKRDISERGRSINGVLQQYEKFVKPSFENYIAPTKKFADLIIPRGLTNTVAINIITEHLRSNLKDRGITGDDTTVSTPQEWDEIPENVVILPFTTERRYIHTIIRDSNCSRDDFIFHSERLFRLLVEEAQNLLPFETHIVTTPTGVEFEGLKLTSKICGVSIMRGGSTMIDSFHAVIKDGVQGTILIQSDEKKTPMLFFYKMPENLTDCYIFLFDPIVGTGKSLSMAIRVLLENGIPEDHIIFITVIASPAALHSIAYTFPKLKVVASEIDQGLDQDGFLTPGIGNFGDRFYGTEHETSS